MIEITYNSDVADIFEIYLESDTHIYWEDHARNHLRINKINNKVSMFLNGKWESYNSVIKSYRII